MVTRHNIGLPKDHLPHLSHGAWTLERLIAVGRYIYYNLGELSLSFIQPIHAEARTQIDLLPGDGRS